MDGVLSAVCQELLMSLPIWFKTRRSNRQKLKKETGIVIDELNDINDNPEELIFDKFEELLFAGIP